MVDQGHDALAWVKVLVKFVEHLNDMAGDEVQFNKALIVKLLSGVVFHRVTVKKELLIFLMYHIR